MNFGGVTMKGYDTIAAAIAKLIPVYIFMNDNPFDPYSVYYTIYGVCGQTIQTNQQATRFTTGEYYANFPWTVQTATLKMGTFKIVWDIKESYYSTVTSVTDEFSVYKARSQSCQAPHLPTGYDPNKRQSGTGNFPDFGYPNACWQYSYSQYNLQWGITCGSYVNFTRQSGTCNYPCC